MSNLLTILGIVGFLLGVIVIAAILAQREQDARKMKDQSSRGEIAPK